MRACYGDSHMCKRKLIQHMDTSASECVGPYVGPSSATANLKSSLRADKQAAKGASRNPTSLGRKEGMESEKNWMTANHNRTQW